MENKMKVEIWSDIMCPFCYIGKRHYEAALAQFPHADKIQTEWRSFQLDPTNSVPEGQKTNVYDYLAKRKHITREASVKMHAQVADMARNAGLEYNFDKAVIANSLRAHKLIQLAKSQHKDDALEELLFKAYFMEGKDVNDIDTLVAIGSEIGLQEADIRTAMDSESIARAVHQDIAEAEQLGIRGVPFFVVNHAYGVSGAQPVEAFLKTLEQSYKEWDAQQSKVTMMNTDGPSCSTDGVCE